MKELIDIENDVYFISRRLKEIDKSYEVKYNLNQNAYEVHSNEQERNSYCFRVPYPVLDERTISYALKTRAENRDKLIEEIEKNNELLYQKNIKNQVNLIKEALC